MSGQGRIEALQAPLEQAIPVAVPLVRTFIRDLAEGDSVGAVFCVRERERRTRRNGDDFLRLVIADRTGTAEAVAWEDVDESFEHLRPRRGRVHRRPLLGASAVRREDHHPLDPRRRGW